MPVVNMVMKLLIHPTNAKSPGIVQEVIDLVQHSRLAGLVLTPPFSEMPEIAEALSRINVDFVRIISGSTPSPKQTNCVLVDDFTAAFKITNHLLELGHSQIAFLCGDEEHSSSGERLAGFKAALTKRGIETNPKFIVPGSYSFESGVKGATQLLALANKPTAIFACNDEIAAGALFSARLQHIEIPQQLSIVGFENSPFSRQTWPPLTTAHQPNSIIAQSAAELLFKHTRPGCQNQTDDQPVFIPELLVRESTAPVESEFLTLPHCDELTSVEWLKAQPAAAIIPPYNHHKCPAHNLIPPVIHPQELKPDERPQRQQEQKQHHPHWPDYPPPYKTSEL